MGGGSSGVSPPSQTSVFNPWKGQKPYLLDIYNQAQNQSQTPLQYYPGQTVAPQDEATMAALSAAEQRAKAGSPLLTGAQNLTQQQLSGDFLNSNPYIDKTYDLAARAVTRNFNDVVLPNLSSRFAASGNLGSSAYQFGLGRAGDSLATSLGDLATQIYGQNYANERNIQQGSIANAQPLAQADYADIGQLASVGASREQYAQSLIDELVNRFNFAQQEPGTRLARYAGLIGAPVGATATAYGNTARGGNWLGLFGV